MPCDSNPCKNDGECQNIRQGSSKDFYCICKVGWTSKDCSEDIDECVTLGPKLCDRRDSTANCTNLLGGEYKCSCGSMWFGKTCEINKIISDILETTYGYVNDDDLEKLTEDLMNDPTIVRDIIPFLIGNYNTEIRSNLSWNYEDFFIWASFDEEAIDVGTDFVMWNDKVLGNCFTFNHHNSTVKYAAKRSGIDGGLALQANVRQDEYLPWIETATIMVFTHSGTETIFSESPRINCRENHEIQLDLLPNKFVRLGGLYGKCVSDVSEVASYYYGGSYTTDGCLRSCYQDVIKKECKCMDPRYPMPDQEVTCTLSQRNCIESLSVTRGDPSKWEECSCPLPCTNVQYQVAWKEVSYVNQGLQYEQKKDMVVLKAGLPSLMVKTFLEEPEMNVVEEAVDTKGVQSSQELGGDHER
uniref:EGF-like domain-containing protein n=1 Tax=Heterorhabditis bacteriophora TaxID=37862 RepID=A0A1I7XKD2_HETBA